MTCADLLAPTPLSGERLPEKSWRHGRGSYRRTHMRHAGGSPTGSPLAGLIGAAVALVRHARSGMRGVESRVDVRPMVATTLQGSCHVAEQ
jgi:hypothetical protein